MQTKKRVATEDFLNELYSTLILLSLLCTDYSCTYLDGIGIVNCILSFYQLRLSQKIMELY